MSVAVHKHFSRTHAPLPRGSHKPELERSAVCKGAFGVLGHSQSSRAREECRAPQKIAICVALFLIFIVAVV